MVDSPDRGPSLPGCSEEKALAALLFEGELDTEWNISILGTVLAAALFGRTSSGASHPVKPVQSERRRLG
jgi:hypothetical protein